MGKGIVWASLLVVMGTFFSKILGFTREIIFAYQFGASTVSDAFFLTNSIPLILFSAVAIAINTSFIPLYMQISERKERDRFTSILLDVCLVITIIGVIIINLYPYQVLYCFASSLPNKTLYYAVPMLRVASISIIPIILGCIFQAYSQSHNQFASTAVLGIVTNIVIIISYLLASEEHFLVLSFGAVIAQVIAMFMFLYNAYSLGFKYRWGFEVNNPALKSLVVLALPLMIGRFAEDASVLVDRNLAASLGTGIISSLSYASLLSNAINSMITNSIITAAFPFFSKTVAEGDVTEFSTAFQKYFRFICYFLCPVSIFMVLFSDDIVTCIFQHGSLSSPAAKIIWECTACYAAGILPLGLQNYLVRGYYAFHDTKKPTYILVVSLMCNIFLSIWSANVIGYIGIAISTSISYFIACGFLSYYFQTGYGIPIFKLTYKDLFLGCFFSIFSATIVYCLFHIIWFTENIVLRFVLESLVFMTLYFVICLYAHREYFHRLILFIKKEVKFNAVFAQNSRHRS